MSLALSTSAQHLLLRGFFLLLALGAFYSVWDNREFFLRFPFYLTAFTDIAFAFAFLFFSVLLPRFLEQYYRIVWYGVLLMWVYTLLTNSISVIIFVQAIGLADAATMAGFTIPLFVASEILYALVLPSLAFGVVLWILGKQRHAIR